MKTFIVTGIQMRNKGSQAMFLTLYHYLTSHYKNCEVIGFATKYASPEQYVFKLMPFDEYTRFALWYRLWKLPLLVSLITFLIGRLRKSDKWDGKIPEMERALRRADAIFDASGYTLGSGWPKQGGRLLLQTIKLARRYKKGIVLMPQSFGPFDWGEKDDATFVEQVRKELVYPAKIYAREKEGYECLISLGLGNVELSADMVIREKRFPSAREIFVSSPKEKEHPLTGSVGLIINENVFRTGDPSIVLDLYVRIIKHLTDVGEKVYVVNTSGADIKLVEDILRNFPDRDNIGLICEEHSSPELIAIMSNFKYVVASRYHSVVFAYRSGVPAVILGWASKYIDLAELFQQQHYVSDIRNANVERIFQQINEMRVNHERESHLIRSRLEAIQTTSVIEKALTALGE